jgi:hypothetical protein
VGLWSWRIPFLFGFWHEKNISCWHKIFFDMARIFHVCIKYFFDMTIFHVGIKYYHDWAKISPWIFCLVHLLTWLKMQRKIAFTFVTKGAPYTKHHIILPSVMPLLFRALNNKCNFNGDERTCKSKMSMESII